MDAVVVGGTGLVGSHLVEELLQDNNFEKVIVLTRRVFGFHHPKLTNIVVDFDNISGLENSFEKADVIFCTVGTTQKKVQGDEKAYRKVDYDIPVNMAKIGLKKGVNVYILVSSVGADAKAGNFYLRLKGEVEEAISSMSFLSVYILRPSMLLGKRKEFRLGESIGKAVIRSASFLFFGPIRKYHPVKAKEVANAMVSASRERKPGVNFLYYDEMMRFR